MRFAAHYLPELDEPGQCIEFIEHWQDALGLYLHLGDLPFRWNAP